MSRKSSSSEASLPDLARGTSASENQQRSNKKDSIKHYVNDVLIKHGISDGLPAKVKIGSRSDPYPNYENSSAFQRYQSDAQRTERQSSSSDDELEDGRPTQQSSGLDDSMVELNLDPDPVYEERASVEQTYRQKVYLRQLQPPTPQPVEIQVQEVLIPQPPPKAPIHVRVAQREPRTPSPIIIKTAPPAPPPIDPDETKIYNKYIPPLKQPPQQIIIHRYPELPPKPRPIVVEQWLPYKPAPKRIIKHTLPPEAYQPAPVPRNVIIAYAKPRAVIEVEYVRLPVVKIDPQTYQQMSAGGQQQLVQHPTFQHEQGYLSRNRETGGTLNTNSINWRI